ncbi:uncharacterized protein LAJ45_00928 [Morchella importuna]|uniref:Uncharacterized protein n=1 Tax=Morchella conica CCBAS932 TaxID=1392247 RepID=A0A3N4KCT9_9PEZI|nr:uncharacterized protein LAJ45_00928 [Morchella importuna]KAH8154401.1 hypothetical protein LAJ45_00928 [Morchella importuna]RPB07159.1 hypothetical protein P167DRAFT_568762 [Morchella conica CCBAS932]
MHAFTPLFVSLLLSSTAIAASNVGIMPRSILLSGRQLQCSGANPNICEQTENTIKCGQNCCSDGTSCEFGYSCESGGRCCDITKPLSQCGVATLCYDASDSKCPDNEACCPSSAPYCTYQGGRAICELNQSFTITNTLTSTSTNTNTVTSTLSSVVTPSISATKSSESSSSSSISYTTPPAYSSSSTSTIHPTTTSVGSNITAPNSTVSQPPVFSGGAAGREGFLGAGVVAVVLAVGGAFI